MTDDVHRGPEKRKEQRRKKSHRREEIRFEPDKDDRRQNPGRRKTDGDVWNKRGEE